jgi:hypothetical protein
VPLNARGGAGQNGAPEVWLRCRSVFRPSAPMRTESDCSDEVVDLAIALPIDHPSCLTLCRTSSGATESPTFVAVLDSLDVAKIASEPVELRTGGTHEFASFSLRSARMMRSTTRASVYTDNDVSSHPGKVSTLAEWLIVRDQIEVRIRRSQRQLEQFGAYRGLARHIGHGAQLRRRWETLDVGRQSAIVRTLVDHVVVSRGRRGHHPFDPSRPEMVWRL